MRDRYQVNVYISITCFIFFNAVEIAALLMTWFLGKQWPLLITQPVSVSVGKL